MLQVEGNSNENKSHSELSVNDNYVFYRIIVSGVETCLSQHNLLSSHSDVPLNPKGYLANPCSSLYRSLFAHALVVISGHGCPSPGPH